MISGQKKSHFSHIVSADSWQNSSFRPPAVVAFIHHLVADIEKQKAPVPTMSALNIKLIELCNQDQPSLTNIADLVSMDFSLGRQIIQYSNWRFQDDQPTDSIQNAVHRVGALKVRNIAIARQVSAFFQHKMSATAAERLKIAAQYMIRCATMAEIMARPHDHIENPDAQLGGLLSLIGMLPIIARYDQHPDLLHDIGMLDRVLVYDHAKVGQTLLRSWGLAIEFSQLPQKVADLTRISYNKITLEDVVTVANLHAHLGKQHPLARVDWKTVPAVVKMNASPQETLRVIQKMKTEVGDVQFLLNL